MKSFKTPILLIVFNRPEESAQIFKILSKIKPLHLYIAADGPRPGNEEDLIDCVKVRNLVTKIGWKCNVKTLFRTKNLGCKLAVSSAVSWFFNNVEQGIIIEDDCEPDPSFFNYCQTLLEYYKNSNKVMHIGGNNFQKNQTQLENSYYFSIYPHIWGWATWRRAWKYYDPKMRELPDFIKNNKIDTITPIKSEKMFWLSFFNKAFTNSINAWSYNWVFSIWNCGGLCISPSVNLVKNIGYGTKATNTVSDKNKFGNLKKNSIYFPLKHPTSLNTNIRADRYSYNIIYKQKFHIRKLKYWILSNTFKIGKYKRKFLKK